jgi:hypothetical protein
VLEKSFLVILNTVPSIARALQWLPNLSESSNWLLRVCTGIPDLVGRIKSLDRALRVRYEFGKLDIKYTRVWHSPHPAAEEVHIVVAVEWMKCKVKHGFGFAYLKEYYKKKVFQGEFYLIRADNESEPAK